jgi:hypothetical protein
MNHPNEKQEIIEQALHEAVGGGRINLCSISCHIFSKDVCYVDLCGTEQQVA